MIVVSLLGSAANFWTDKVPKFEFWTSVIPLFHPTNVHFALQLIVILIIMMSLSEMKLHHPPSQSLELS
jgi:hypothetical protein